MNKLFGYPEFDENGVMTLTTYDNEYSDMNMDIRLYQIKSGNSLSFEKMEEEVAVLLLSGQIRIQSDNIDKTVSRIDVFTEGPWCMHVCAGKRVAVTACSDSEILVQCTKNKAAFSSKLYAPEDAPWKYSCIGKFGDVAKRRVNTIFDHSICPESNMVLGEVLNDKGNWSGYLPHRHPQPETYLFKFDHSEGFGASFVGDHVFKSVNNSFAAIPGGELHPQAVAPGYQMYTCWMIRHIEGNPWLQTDRCEDERFTWLHNEK
ncbi:MAG: 5-deoxy-glucuronate isomerase [Candidatus Choladocola sp.]|nr:5-deoxy-glucuronate isomerase [Candidatus Choladocola sp.]